MDPTGAGRGRRGVLEAFRGLVGRAWRALPARLTRRLLKEAILAEAGAPPERALERLFDLSDTVDTAIGDAALRYGDGVHPKHRLMDYHRFFCDRIRSGERVLDVGCGYGAVAASIAVRSGAEVLGIDHDAASIEQARRDHPGAGLTFSVGRVPEDLPEGHRDVVVLSNVLEHISDRRGFLRMLVERVTPSRILVRLPLFDRSWTVAMRAELGLPFFSDDTHFAEKTAEGWGEELEEAGLSVVHREVRWGEIWCEAVPREAPGRS